MDAAGEAADDRGEASAAVGEGEAGSVAEEPGGAPDAERSSTGEPQAPASTPRTRTNANAGRRLEVTKRIGNTAAPETATQAPQRLRAAAVRGTVVAVASRRLLVLLLALAVIAVPAGALRAACAGRSCAADRAAPRVPFCPLPDWMKSDVAAGYREGRSPDVLAVSARAGLSAAGADAAPWPSVADGPSITRVPVAFWGRGVDPSARVPDGTTLDAIAPTIAEAIGLHRPHPDVRSGVAVPGVTNGDRPALVLEVVLQGIGTNDVQDARADWPELGRLLRSAAGTPAADTGSLPLDPAAILTTIGTGGLPDQHGITGSLIRGDDGRVVPAWSDPAPPSVIATLADDLDNETGNAARIGLVAPATTDRGLIGGTWYPNGDRDDVVTVASDRSARVVAAVRSVLDRGYGADDVPDILGVVLDGRAAGADDAIGRVVDAALRVSHGSALVVLTGTGSSGVARGGIYGAVAQVEDGVPGDASVVTGVVPGGFFLDQRVMARERISGQTVVDALLDAETPEGAPLVRDAFQGFAVSFARYC